jgi:hypothetical protein
MIPAMVTSTFTSGWWAMTSSAAAAMDAASVVSTLTV